MFFRYHADPEYKSQYHAELEEQIKNRENNEQRVKDQDVAITRKLEVGRRIIKFYVLIYHTRLATKIIRRFRESIIKREGYKSCVTRSESIIGGSDC